VKTQRPIVVEEEEHRVLQFRPRNPALAPGLRRNIGAPAPLHDIRQEAARQEAARPDASRPDASRPEAVRLHVAREDTRPEPNDLSRYERPRDEPDDFRHRMLANIAAFAFTVALTAIGIWLAMSIADLRRTQDCVLMGRRDCVHITTPSI
jgi:hypothetical protein